MTPLDGSPAEQSETTGIDKQSQVGHLSRRSGRKRWTGSVGIGVSMLFLSGVFLMFYDYSGLTYHGPIYRWLDPVLITVPALVPSLLFFHNKSILLVLSYALVALVFLCIGHMGQPADYYHGLSKDMVLRDIEEVSKDVQKYYVNSTDGGAHEGSYTGYTFDEQKFPASYSDMSLIVSNKSVTVTVRVNKIQSMYQSTMYWSFF